MNGIGRDGVKQDRKLGEYWENEFIKIVKAWGWEAWAFSQKRGPSFRDALGNSYISPDVWVLRRGNKQYAVEVKHKTVASNGCYGFELYRQESMLQIESNYTNQYGGVVALYVVHNHAMAGGKFERKSKIEHWHVQRLRRLAKIAKSGMSKTYRRSQVTDDEVPIMYYPFSAFVPLANIFGK